MNEVRLTRTVITDVTQQLEALYTNGSPESRRRLEALLGFIRDIVDETRLVSTDTPQGYAHLRTRSDFNSWGSRYFSPPVLPPRQATPPFPVHSAEPPPARAQPQERVQEHPYPQRLGPHPETVSRGTRALSQGLAVSFAMQSASCAWVASSSLSSSPMRVRCCRMASLSLASFCSLWEMTRDSSLSNGEHRGPCHPTPNNKQCKQP